MKKIGRAPGVTPPCTNLNRFGGDGGLHLERVAKVSHAGAEASLHLLPGSPSD